MAAPEKRTVDYFPFSVKDGKTLFILESKYQCKGTGFFTNLMRFLCLQPDHYYQIKDEADAIWFFSKAHCDEESGMDMMNIMSKTGKIDPELWNNHRVIVCQDLLNSIKDAYRNRNSAMIDISQIRVNYPTNAINDVINPPLCGISDVSNPQRKEKKIKVNKTLCVYTDAFLSFWKVYPKHASKKSAFREWEKATDKPPLEAILSALEKQKRAKKALIDAGQFSAEWPDPERYIKKERWEDEISAPQPGGNGNGSGGYGSPGKAFTKTGRGDDGSSRLREYQPERPPTEEERQRNITKIQALIAGNETG